MALSNWDTLAIGNDGKATKGVVTFSSGTTVELYKNGVCIENEKMWIDGTGFSFPTIAHIDKGNVTIGGVYVYAERGWQQGIYLLATHYNKESKKYEYFGGIGCYGYKNSKWIGVEKKTVADYKQWLEKVIEEEVPDAKEWFTLIDWDNLVRYNQGDLFFAEHLGTELNATTPSEVETPLMEHLINNMNNEN